MLKYHYTDVTGHSPEKKRPYANKQKLIKSLPLLHQHTVGFHFSDLHSKVRSGDEFWTTEYEQELCRPFPNANFKLFHGILDGLSHHSYVGEMPKDPVEDFSGIREIGAGEHLGPLTTVNAQLSFLNLASKMLGCVINQSIYYFKLLNIQRLSVTKELASCN